MFTYLKPIFFNHSHNGEARHCSVKVYSQHVECEPAGGRRAWSGIKTLPPEAKQLLLITDSNSIHENACCRAGSIYRNVLCHIADTYWYCNISTKSVTFFFIYHIGGPLTHWFWTKYFFKLAAFHSGHFNITWPLISNSDCLWRTFPSPEHHYLLVPSVYSGCI